MVGCRKRSNTGGRGYGQNHPYMQCRGSRRAFTTAGAPFHAVSRHEKGAPGQFFPFSLSHMHYVGRSFRLLNQFSRPSPAHSEAFSGRKFHRTEIFCRKPEENAQIRGGRRNFDEEGENHSRPVNAFPQMASHISFSIFSSLWDRTSMSLLIFWLVIRAYIWVVFKSV